MWPGIKTETGLPEAPSAGQSGFLSFSTAYTSTQPGQLHYSYPSQGKLQQPHSVSQRNALTLPATQNIRRPCSGTALFSLLSLLRFCGPVLKVVSVSRLKLHNIQCVLQHPICYSCHYSLHSCAPSGENKEQNSTAVGPLMRLFKCSTFSLPAGV